MTFASSTVSSSTTMVQFVLITEPIDIVICEDDPYYFQQEGKWVPKDGRKSHSASIQESDPARYVEGLTPSYLRSVLIVSGSKR